MLSWLVFCTRFLEYNSNWIKKVRLAAEKQSKTNIFGLIQYPELLRWFSDKTFRVKHESDDACLLFRSRSIFPEVQYSLLVILMAY